MDRFVHCDLSEVRQSSKPICLVADCPACSSSVLLSFNTRITIPTNITPFNRFWKLYTQSELKSSLHENQQAPDAPPSTPQSHASPDVLDDSEPLCSADRRGKDRNESIGQRRGTRGRPSSIIVPDTVLPLSSAGAGDDAQAQRISKSVKAGAIHRTSPAAIERNLPTYSADYAPIDKPLKGHVGHRGKKRKLGSDAVAGPKPQEEVHATPASKPHGTSTCVQPHALDEEALEVATLPPDLLGKLSLIGSVEVLRDLQHILFRLRSHPSQGSLVLIHETGTPCTGSEHDTLRSL